jgi:SHS2 domain-containing protein
MFKILSHTADIRLYVTASESEELFESALRGMANLQKGDFCEQQDQSFVIQDSIQLNAIDRTSLLIDFLSKVLTLSQINRVIYCKVNFLKLSDTELTATIEGNKVNFFDEDIKAVTYHEAELIENKDRQLETVIIFDI